MVDLNTHHFPLFAHSEKLAVMCPHALFADVHSPDLPHFRLLSSRLVPTRLPEEPKKMFLAYVIAIMNMILHGIEAPNILHTNKFLETRPPEVIANIAICLIHQTNYLLDQQLRALEKDFLNQGGLRERLFQARLQHRRQNRPKP